MEPDFMLKDFTEIRFYKRRSGPNNSLKPSEAKVVKLLKKGELIWFPGFPHGMTATEAATINADLFAFIKSWLM